MSDYKQINSQNGPSSSNDKNKCGPCYIYQEIELIFLSNPSSAVGRQERVLLESEKL